MKTLIFFIASVLISMMGMSSNHEKTEFKVYGACGMCEARIEKAAEEAGVKTADWSQQTQILTITYDPVVVSLDEVHRKIAEAGHDTEEVRAKDETYENLPACCHYDRREVE